MFLLVADTAGNVPAPPGLWFFVSASVASFQDSSLLHDLNSLMELRRVVDFQCVYLFLYIYRRMGVGTLGLFVQSSRNWKSLIFRLNVSYRKCVLSYFVNEIIISSKFLEVKSAPVYRLTRPTISHGTVPLNGTSGQPACRRHPIILRRNNTNFRKYQWICQTTVLYHLRTSGPALSPSAAVIIAVDSVWVVEPHIPPAQVACSLLTSLLQVSAWPHACAPEAQRPEFSPLLPFAGLSW